MSSVIVRGMEMPETCASCRFSGFGGYKHEETVCMFTGRHKNTMLLAGERLTNCPLRPLPSEHGALVDRDALLFDLASNHIGGLDAIKEYKGTDTWTDGLHTAWRCIDDAPTIVDAERKGE